jgi:predicted AlkP superfamily phosphohydrolase/phosphomutase
LNLPRVIILGIDGMDPNFLQAHWSSLPNLDRLRRAGEFQRLRTSFPPQSPVAWSTFITGADPTVHGIYDFVHRNPRTLLPFSSLGETLPARYTIPLGAYQIPLSSPTVQTFRRGRAFWEGLAQRGIPVTILRMPMNYPPPDEDGDFLSGMGVPDMQGAFGTFSFYTDDPAESTHDVPGGRIVSTPIENGRALLRILGPPNPFRRDAAFAALDLVVDLDAAAPVARFTVGEQSFILRQGEWSGWIETEFPLIPGVRSAHGMFRVYARQLAPGFEVYVSPINVDPTRPAVKISTPASYSGRLADAAGLYYTQGMPQDTAALRQHVFDRGEYLAQSRTVSREHIALLKEAVKEFKGGLLFFHFFGVDQDSHMLWGKFDADLLGTYKMVDDAVGWVRAREKNATLIVMSDHGFASFDRAVNLNTWLMSQGFLRLRDSSNIDWSATQAYSLGLNSLYLNLQSREEHGLVARRDAAELSRQIAQRLIALRDPDTGKQVVTAVWRPHPEFAGDIEYAPDLVVGFAAGYRASWDGALGSVAAQTIEDNRDEWIGDHCMDPRAVPGVLIENRKSRLSDPGLKDLSASIPALFGLPH